MMSVMWLIAYYMGFALGLFLGYRVGKENKED